MELDTILNIMAEYNLTGEELLLVYLTFISQSENGNSEYNRVYFKKWYENGGKHRLKELFDSLQSKGVIVKNYNPEAYDPNEIQFNKNFIKKYWKYSGTLGQELLQAYPDEMYLNGRPIYLKNIVKHFINESDFYFWYSTKIGHSIEKHKKILDILKWASENNLITFGIIEFIASRKWELFEKMRDKGINGSSSTYDIYST